MRSYPIAQLGILRQNYPTTEDWQADCLCQTLTMVNPRTGTITTHWLAPRLIHDWLMRHAEFPFTVRGLGGNASMTLDFEDESDAELYRLRWL